MSIEYPSEKFLFDDEGGFVAFNPIKNPYTALTANDYQVIDLTYNRNVYISKESLEDFDPIEETGQIGYSKKNKFKVFYKYWYNIELDFYITIASGAGRYDEYDDEVDPSDEMHKISTIFYKYDNVQDVYRYLNDNMTDEVSTKNAVDIIIQTQTGYEFREHFIKPLEIDIDTMYNDDFKPIHEHIMDKLNTVDKGIVLLHGEKGTGKSNYLKWLTRHVDSKFVFIPINMIAHISSPAFIGDLIDNKGTILIIEDCEQYIQDRRGSDTSIVSPLLQLTDGFLSDIVGVKIIATFNDDSAKVDPALKREGRLIAEYEFGKLEADKVEVLTEGRFNEPMTLAQIYNTLTYKENIHEEKKIGFGR